MNNNSTNFNSSSNNFVKTRSKRRYNNNAIIESANQTLSLIRNTIKQEMQTKGLQTASSCELCSAIVDKVNEDGSVDIYFPPDKENLFTRISNQTSFNLQVGDCVEITLKNGSFSNCWVSARHNTKENLNFRQTERLQKEALTTFLIEQKQINEQFSIAIQQLQDIVNSLK